jgi:hypothetical protein
MSIIINISLLLISEDTQLPKRYVICSIQSTPFRCKDIEQDGELRGLDYYAYTGGPYILHQGTLTTTSHSISTPATYNTTSGSRSRETTHYLCHTFLH